MVRLAFSALFGLTALIGAALGDDMEFKTTAAPKPAPAPRPAPAAAPRPVPRPSAAPAPRPAAKPAPARPAALAKPAPVVRSAGLAKPAGPRPAVQPPVRAAIPPTSRPNPTSSKPASQTVKPASQFVNPALTKPLVQQGKPTSSFAVLGGRGPIQSAAQLGKPSGPDLALGSGQRAATSIGSTGAAGTSVPPSIQYDPSAGITLVQSANIASPTKPGDIFTVSYGRRMDASGKTTELYGVYSSKADADKAVTAIKAWADRIKKNNAELGVAKSDWDITSISVDRQGSAPATTKPTTGSFGYDPNAIKTDATGKPGATASSPTARPLGWLSERYEVGKGGVGTISTGKGDRGGVSYGTYQLSSRTGTAKQFVDRFYGKEFKGLTPGTKAFNDRWSELARKNPAEFGRKQHDFIKETHFDPAVRQLQRDTGLNVAGRSQALQNAVWSTSVQNGPKGAARVIERALGTQKNPAKASDADIIRAIYAERGRTNADGDLVYFSGSSAAVQQSVANRFEREQRDALAALAQEQRPTAQPLRSTPLP